MPIFSRAFEDLRRQPVLRRHVPLALPIAADERDHDVVDEGAAAVPHQGLFFGQGHGGIFRWVWRGESSRAHRIAGTRAGGKPLEFALEGTPVRPTIFVTFFAIALGLAPAAAAPRAPTMQDVNAAELKPNAKPAQAVNIKAQVLLDRASFSPGAIDGRDSDNLEHALRGFQKKNVLPETGKLDKETWDKLTQSTEPALIEYTITAADLKGPFADDIPDEVRGQGQAQAPRLHQRHRDARRALPHGRDVSRDAQSRQGFRQGRHGDRRRERQRETGRADARGRQDRSRQSNNVVRVLAKDGALIASYPASIGSDDKPAPSGTLKVVRVAHGPTYTYDPAFKFKGVKADEKLHIAPGPNNPVGAVWIALDQKTYGIHGTSEPSEGRQGRLAWLRAHDQLGCAGDRRMVRKGMPVVFID